MGDKFAKMYDVKLGDMLIVATDDYECLPPGQKCEVLQDHNGRLFIECAEDKHYLDKVMDCHGYLDGLQIWATV
jgi:hypothetical protein